MKRITLDASGPDHDLEPPVSREPPPARPRPTLTLVPAPPIPAATVEDAPREYFDSWI